MGERGQKDLFNGADIVLIRCCYKNPNQSGSLRSEIKRDIRSYENFVLVNHSWCYA